MGTRRTGRTRRSMGTRRTGMTRRTITTMMWRRRLVSEIADVDAGPSRPRS